MPYQVERKRIELRLGKVLNRMGISQREFARLTGMRLATVNDLVNNKNKSQISLHNILVIMQFFQTEDFNKIFEIVEYDPEEDGTIHIEEYKKVN